MNTYYCVTTSFDDLGRVTAAITSVVETTQMPEATCTSTRRKDIYCDWFDSLWKAKAFVEESRRA